MNSHPDWGGIVTAMQLSAMDVIEALGESVMTEEHGNSTLYRNSGQVRGRGNEPGMDGCL